MLGSETSVIRTLIVDDHPVVRYGIRHMLNTESDIEVVGELEKIDDIGSVLSELRPDVILLDLELEETHGVESLRLLREEAPGMHIIIYTSYDDEQHIIGAAELGVDGYLLKDCPRKEIVSAIRNVYVGGTALEASVASKLMHHMHERSSRRERLAVHFSKREKQVLELLAEGNTNRDIGAKLFISESTVKFHVHAILSKLDASNRTEAVSIAAHQGIIDLATSAVAGPDS